MHIERLPEQAIKLIRAGEVITSPAAVVNELIANALDAGASDILVTISANARDISVQDNGVGMSPEQIWMASQAHTTSKFRGIQNIGISETFGFRGEALHSIQTMASSLKIDSRPVDSDMAMSLSFTPETASMSFHDMENNGLVRPCAIHGQGTCVSIQNLFETHIPRLKHMKTPGREIAKVRDVIISWGLFNEARITLEVRKNKAAPRFYLDGKFDDRVRHILLDRGNVLAWVNETMTTPEMGEIVIRGAILSTKDKYFAINGRPIQSQGFIDSAQFSTGGENGFILSVTADVSEIDVNIHPEKARVSCRGNLSSHIMQAILKAQAGDLSHLRSSVSDTKKEMSRHGKETSAYRILGMVEGKFAVAANGDTMLLCDIHAAHERMLQDKSLGMKTEKMCVEALLSSQESEILHMLMPALEREGWGIFEDGDGIVITQAPTTQESALIVLRRILTTNQSPLADIACHHAWRKGQAQDNELFLKIIEYALTVPGGRFCNHGRPTVIILDNLAMEHLFDRK